VTRQAEYLAGWMRGVGLEGGAVVGHDLGRGIAQIPAVRTPELVRGLVLTNAICYDSWPIPSVKAMRVAGPLVERLPNALVRFNLYVGLFLRGYDDRARAKESLEEH
jgi:pimeloyl-ACP methyl ester carboxylesterase